MNTPLLITSAILLVSVAARPVDNSLQDDNLRELVHSPSSNGQHVFLGRVPALEPLDSLHLHDLHEEANFESDTQSSTKSPKLAATELSQPDPGLASPYVGPQRHLATHEQQLRIAPLSSDSTQSPPAPAVELHPQHVTPESPDYSPMVVVLVLSSLAALVLLGLTISVVYVMTGFRHIVLNKNVWRSISRGQDIEAKDVLCSEKSMIARQISKQIRDVDEDKAVTIATREIPLPAPAVPPPILSEKAVDHGEDYVSDPDVMPLPEPPASPIPTIAEQEHERSLKHTFAVWSYDNWVGHFMVALFGWVGLLFGGIGGR